MFGIVTAGDFRDKARRDCEALQADIANPDLAMNAVLSNFHLYEWVWAQILKPMTPPTLRGAVFRSKAEWLQWLDANCPHFPIMQALANGSKHCFVANDTEKVGGYGEGPYGVGPFGKPYLLIDLGAEVEPENRWLVGHELIEKVSAFWEAASAGLEF